jgi:RimJ/RimL family protein N-acetyltransferase
MIIRPYRVEDAPALAEAIEASVEHLRPWMPWIALEPRTLEQREAWILDEAGEAVGIFDDDDRTVIGGTGFHSRIGEGGVEIGYWVHVDRVGQGIATRAAALLTTQAFERPEIDRVEIHCDEANVASAAIPRTLGYVLVSIEDDEVAAPGEIGRSMIWRMTRDLLESSTVPVVTSLARHQ